MRAVVVGADGFVGRWLVRHLHEQGDEVAAVVGGRYRPPLDGAETVVQADVRDYEPLARAISEARPQALYFLAAVSSPDGREEITDATRIGLVGAIHALTACAGLESPVRMLHVSSSHVYAESGRPLLTESDPVGPMSMYGAAKAASERALLTLAPIADVDVVVARPFNHTGPGQATSFLVPSMLAEVQAIPRGGRGVVRIGMPTMVRDLTDVRDVVRAYRLLITHGVAGEIYNVASGTGILARDLVAMMAEVAGVEVELSVDSALARGGEPRAIVGAVEKIAALGWQPEISLRRTLADMLKSGR